jgi:hypothetical protein
MTPIENIRSDRSIVARPRGLARFAPLMMVASLAIACKKDDAKPADAKGTESKDGKVADADTKDGKAPDAKTPDAKAPTPTGDAPVVAPSLTHGDVLAHVMFANPSVLLGEIKTQIAPESAAQFVDESFLRTMGGGALGSRSALATNLDLAKPMGCALVDSTTTKAPLACVIGYTGGSKQLVTDLGEEGKQTDAGSHIAKYSVNGQDLFIDDLGGEVIVSNADELFGKAKGYLADSIIGRASGMATDVEIVAYPADLMRRYDAELRPVFDAMAKPPTLPTGGSAGEKFAGAMAEYGMKSNERTLKMMQEMQQFSMAMSVDGAGLELTYALQPKPGTELAKQYEITSAGPVDAAFVSSLPRSSWGVMGFNAHMSEALDSGPVKELRSALVKGYAEALGKDAGQTEAALIAFANEARATYSGHSALALMQEPGSVGALAAVFGLKDGVNAREAWKTWSGGFTVESLLGADAAKKVTWSFQFDAAKVGEVAVDRWVIEPTDEVKAEMRKDGGAKLAEWETKLGGLKLVVNRVERDGKVAWIVGSAADEASTKAVVDAMAGSASLAGDPGLDKALARTPGASAVMALNVKGMLAWIATLAPPEEAAKIPTGIGSDLNDVVITTTYSPSGPQVGEIAFSQKLVDGIRALANK